MEFWKSEINVMVYTQDGHFDPKGAFQFQIVNHGTALLRWDTSEFTTFSNGMGRIFPGTSQGFGGVNIQRNVSRIFFKFDPAAGGEGQDIEVISEKLTEVCR